MTERMTRADAARALNLDKSTVTRWIQKHPALLGDDGLVDLTELRRHRDHMVNPALQTRGAALPEDVMAGVDTGFRSHTINQHRARGEGAKAINAELDLAQRLKWTLTRADVDEQIGQASEILKRKAGDLARDRADDLARIDDPRAMERALESLMRSLLEQGALALALAISEHGIEDPIQRAET